MKNRLAPQIVAFTLVLIAICSAALDYYLPAMGDDLRFWHLLGLENYHLFDRTTLKFIAGHIAGCNGRIFDYLGPVVINLLPRWLAAGVMGGMAGLYFYAMTLSLNLPRKGSYGAFTLAFIAVTLAVMPWWDAMWLRVCQFNYSWATTAALLFVYFYFGKPNIKKTWAWCLLFILGVCAGGMHEQIGVALSTAFILLLWLGKRYKRVTSMQKAMLAGLGLGTLMPLVSPAFWSRLGGESYPDDTLHLIETTIPVYAVALCTILGLSISTKGRRFLRRVFTDSAIILFLGASCAAAIAILSGIPGRTGWFAESASLILLGRMVLKCNFRSNKVVAFSAGALALLFIGVHYGFSIQAQQTAYAEYTAVKDLYLASPNGVVYYDFTNRYDFPSVTLNRAKGVPDADDRWNRYVLSETYRNPSDPNVIILPATFKGRLPIAADSLTVGSATIYRQRPANVFVTSDSLLLQRWHGGTLRVVEELPDGEWVATELILDPGDYHFQ